jgi:hypothetical protein
MFLQTGKLYLTLFSHEFEFEFIELVISYYSENRRKKQGKAPIDIKPLMAKKHDKILN